MLASRPVRDRNAASAVNSRHPRIFKSHLLPRVALQVWLRVVKYRLSHGDGEGARKALDRSLQVLGRCCIWGVWG